MRKPRKLFIIGLSMMIMPCFINSVISNNTSEVIISVNTHEESISSESENLMGQSQEYVEFEFIEENEELSTQIDENSVSLGIGIGMISTILALA